MQAKYFIWCLPEVVIVFPKGQEKLVILDLVRDSIVLFVMRNFREFSVLVVTNCSLEFDLELCVLR